MNAEAPGKRRYARLALKEPVSDQITTTYNVHILDVSLGGARVEHTSILRPGSACHLRLPLKPEALTVQCRVVWSKVIGRATGESRGTGLLYQSGLEFAGIPPGAQGALAAFLEVQDTPPPGQNAPR